MFSLVIFGYNNGTLLEVFYSDINYISINFDDFSIFKNSNFNFYNYSELLFSNNNNQKDLNSINHESFNFANKESLADFRASVAKFKAKFNFDFSKFFNDNILFQSKKV